MKISKIDCIDIAKFMASVLIFAMHANALGSFRYAGFVLELMARWGVPFFFICSAYFLFRHSVSEKGIVEGKTILRYISRICLLYFVWFIYNIPSVLFDHLFIHDPYNINTWLLFIKNSMIASTFKGSWYLVSSIFCAWLIYILSKKFKTKVIIFITFIPFLICALTSVYAGVLPPCVKSILNYLCFPLNIVNGCFYFSIGKMFAEHADCILNKIKIQYVVILIILFYMLYICEIFVCNKVLIILSTTDVAFSLPFIGIMIMIFCLKVDVSINNSILLRKLSTIIYCSQGNILLAGKICNQYLHINSSLVLFGIQMVLMAVVCCIVLFIQNHFNCRWTKFLT